MASTYSQPTPAKEKSIVTITSILAETLQIPHEDIAEPREENSLKSNCFLLIVTAGPELRLKSETAKKGGGKAAFLPEGWVWQNKKDAEDLIARFTKGKGNRKFRLVPWYNSLLDDLWGNDKKRSGVAKAKISNLLKDESLTKRLKKIESDCEQSGLPYWWLYEQPQNLPDSISETERKSYDHFKPLFSALLKEIEDLETLKNDTKIYDEDTQADDADLVDLPFHVLGYTKERKVLIWHKGHLIDIPVNQIRKDELSLILGPISDKELTPLKNRIIEEAHSKGLIDEDDPIKSGVWLIKKSWLVVSGKESLLITHNGRSSLDGPVFQERIVQLEKHGWISTKEVCQENNNIKAVFENVLSHVSQWEWLYPGMAEYVAAFVMLSPFQQAMHWRPWLYLSGPTGCGKSYFFDQVIEPIFGKLANRSDKATAHSIAQEVGNTSKLLILDEFEKNRHIPEILELLKLSSRGGNKKSGTTGKNPNTYALHHMPWIASIYLPKTLNIDESQRNRIIRLDLKKKRGGKSINTLSSNEAEKLLSDIISSVLHEWSEIQGRARVLEKNIPSIVQSLENKISGRTVENFMYASALISLATGREYAVPEWAKHEEIDDGQTIIQTILRSKIRYENSEYLVGDLVELACGEPITGMKLAKEGALKALRLNGLSVVNRSGLFIAFLPELIRKSLFKADDDFKDLDISAPLERVPGAQKGIKTAWGEGSRKERCIHVPVQALFPHESGE